MEIWIPVITAIIAAGVSLYAAFIQKKKTDADKEKLLNDTMISLIKPLKDRGDEQETEISELRKEIQDNKDEISALRAKIAEKDKRILEQDRCIAQLEEQILGLKSENELLTSRLEVVEKRRRNN